MKQNHNNRKLYALIVALIVSLLFFSCENSDPISANIAGAENNAPKKQINFLKMQSGANALNKLKRTRKAITRANGGKLELTHGSTRNYLYGTRAYSRTVYKIDMDNVAHPIVAGELAFRAEAIATHPNSGKIYYLGRLGSPVNGLYLHRIGVWDPETGENTELPVQTFLGQGVKLTFAPDGTLYGAHHNNGSRLFTVDTVSGEWTQFETLNVNLTGSGDLAFAPDGTLYNLDGIHRRLQIVDLNTGNVQTVATVNLGNLTGLGFAQNGRAYVSRVYGRIGELDLNTGALTLKGNTQLTYLANLSTLTGRNELSYSDVSLEVLPGSIEQDTEIEISLETTELVGGVAVTFQPHGTIFSTPALLNVEARGVDLSGTNPDAINIYYDNQDTGQWEQMVCDDIIVDVNAGTVKVINARLPHFSRYALAAD